MEKVLDIVRFSGFSKPFSCSRRRRGSVGRVGDLNAEDPGSILRLGLLNEFVLGDPRDKNSPRFVNSQLVCFLPVGILNWERGEF